jgi:hypothetical protein
MRINYLAFLRNSGLAAAMITLAGWAVVDDSVTVPGVAAAVEGNSDNLYPFNGDPMRYQQVITASEFPGGPRTISRIALRPDGVAGAAFSETLSKIQINLSTTVKGPGTLSKTFATNVGDDEAVVYSGELPLSSTFSGTDGGPKDFDIVVTLQTPFTYDPAAGNLLLDVRNYSGGKTTQLDAHDAPDSTARVWSEDVKSPTAKEGDPFPSIGLVIRFLSN